MSLLVSIDILLQFNLYADLDEAKRLLSCLPMIIVDEVIS